MEGSKEHTRDMIALAVDPNRYGVSGSLGALMMSVLCLLWPAIVSCVALNKRTSIWSLIAREEEVRLRIFDLVVKAGDQTIVAQRTQ